MRSISLDGAVGISAHVTNAKHLAPQEIYKPQRYPLKGADELTKQDKKRMRRHAKTIKRSEIQQKDSRLAMQAALDPRKRGAYEKRKALKALQKDKSVTLLPQLQRQLSRTNSK